jgi:hypothetical protein
MIWFIRDHLKIRHYEPEHCPRCGEEFEGVNSHNDRNQHLRQQSCSNVDLAGRWNCINEGQQKWLRDNRKDKKETLTEYWMRIYEQLFVDSSRPEHPCKYWIEFQIVLVLTSSRS